MVEFLFCSYLAIIDRSRRGLILKSREKRWGTNSGFTIMEVMLVLIVVGIMVSGVLPLFITVIQSNKSSEYYSRAYRSADSQLEIYRRASFDSLASGSFAVPSLPGGQGAVTVTNVIDGASQADIKQLDITVSWVFKKNKQVKISSYVTRNGVGR